MSRFKNHFSPALPDLVSRTDLLFDHSVTSTTTSPSSSLTSEVVLATVEEFAASPEEQRPAVFNRMVHEMRQLR